MSIDYEGAHLWSGDSNSKNGVIEALKILQNYYPEFLVRPLNPRAFQLRLIIPSIFFSYVTALKLLHQRTQDFHMAPWNYRPNYIVGVRNNICEDQCHRSGLPFKF